MSKKLLALARKEPEKKLKIEPFGAVVGSSFATSCYKL